MQNVPENFVLGKYTFPISLTKLMSYRQSGVNMLHIVFNVEYFTPVCNVIAAFSEVLSLAIVNVDNFCIYNMITA